MDWICKNEFLRISAGLCSMLFAFWYTSGCASESLGGNQTPMVCGNNIAEEGESCDGTDLRGETCEALGLGDGELACRADCSGFDASECMSEPQCGNNIAEEGETCDGTDLKGKSCESLGLGDGVLACRADCSGFEVSECMSEPQCGNNIAEEGEACDGADLRGQTCESLGLGDGVLACDPDTCQIDTSGCTGEGGCGNGVIDSGESCDGSNLDGKTCETQGFASGDLACNPTTCQFDTSECNGIPDHETDCQDGIDNDQNGETDCVDSDCMSVAPCDRCWDTFDDVDSSHWAYDAIRALYVNLITDGCSSSPLAYCHEDVQTRKSFAVFLVRAMGESPSTVAMNAYFDDLTDPATSPYVNKLYELGVTNGYVAPPNGTFGPDDPVERAAAAVFLIRALNETPYTGAENTFFDDVSGCYAVDEINRLAQLGIASGREPRMYYPYEDLYRSEGAVFIARAFNITDDFCGF